jgi:hypothetical protein
MSAEQGSAEWKMDRAGFASASRFADILSKGRKLKTGGYAPSKTRASYMLQLVAERITGQPYDSYKGGAATERGQEIEHQARMAYVEQTGNIVQQVGFVPHPSIEWCGASPDGLVDDDGGIEIKCPANPMIHLETVLLKNAALAKVLLALADEPEMTNEERLIAEKERGDIRLIPKEHWEQVQGNMWVHDRQWWDFISFDPRFPEGLRLYVHRVHRDERFIAMLEMEVVKFLDEVNDSVSRLILNDGVMAQPEKEAA